MYQICYSDIYRVKLLQCALLRCVWRSVIEILRGRDVVYDSKWGTCKLPRLQNSRTIQVSYALHASGATECAPISRDRIILPLWGDPDVPPLAARSNPSALPCTATQLGVRCNH